MRLNRDIVFTVTAFVGAFGVICSGVGFVFWGAMLDLYNSYVTYGAPNPPFSTEASPIVSSVSVSYFLIVAIPFLAGMIASVLGVVFSALSFQRLRHGLGFLAGGLWIITCLFLLLYSLVRILLKPVPPAEENVIVSLTWFSPLLFFLFYGCFLVLWIGKQPEV